MEGQYVVLIDKFDVHRQSNWA